jgi:hypothetical protein
MIWTLIAIALGCMAINGGKNGLGGFAAFIVAGFIIGSVAGFVLFAPGPALALATAATALFLLVGGLGMLNEWFGEPGAWRTGRPGRRWRRLSDGARAKVEGRVGPRPGV